MVVDRELSEYEELNTKSMKITEYKNYQKTLKTH